MSRFFEFCDLSRDVGRLPVGTHFQFGSKLMESLLDLFLVVVDCLATGFFENLCQGQGEISEK